MKTKTKFEEIALGLIYIVSTQAERLDADALAAFHIIERRFRKVRKAKEKRGPDLVIESDELFRMAITEATSANFYTYMQSLNIKTTNHFDRELDRPHQYSKRQLWADFTDMYVSESGLPLNTFSKWLRLWTTYTPDLMEFDPLRDQYRNNGEFYIFFRKAS